MQTNINANNYIENAETINITYPSGPPNSITSIRNFVGRREDCLDELHKAYDEGAGENCFVLHGLGGVGKTAAGLKFANEILENFPARVFVDIRGMSQTPLSLNEILLQIIWQFERGKYGNTKTPVETDLAQLKVNCTTLIQQQPTLIMLDNAGDEAEIAQFLNLRDVCLIITSRNPIDLGKVVRLVKMQPTDALELLYKTTGDKDKFEGRAGELTELADCLPMALKPLAKLLKKKNKTISAVLAEYEEKKKLLELSDVEYENLSVSASFSLSYDNLTDEIQKYWRSLAVFAGDFEVKAVSSVFGIDFTESENILEELYDYSLIEDYPKNTEGEQRFSLHDLARLFADDKLSKSEEEYFTSQLRHSSHYAFIVQEIQKIRVTDLKKGYSKALKLLDTEWRNIKSGQKWTTENFDKDGSVAEVCIDYAIYSQMFISLRLLPVENIEWLEYALAGATQLQNRQSEGNISGSLGLAYFAVSEYDKALEFQERSLKIRREIKDRLGESASLGNLALVYQNLGEYLKAIDYTEQALKISRDLDNLPGEGNSLSNLANSYRSIGEYKKAIDFYEQALVIQRRIDNQQDEGNALDGLGSVYAGIGKFDQALSCYEKSLEIRKKIGDQRGISGSFGNLGNCYFNLAQYPKAIDYHQQSLMIKREIGDRHGESICLDNLGSVFFRSGKTDEAIIYHKKALKIRRKIGDQQGEVGSLVNLGLVFQSTGKYAEALSSFDTALNISEKIGDKQGTGACLNNLALTYHSLGKHPEAIDYFNRSLAISQKIGNRQGQANSFGGLGNSYSALKQFDTAIDYYQQTAEIMSEIGDRRGASATLQNMGNVSYNVGNYTGAVSYYNEALPISREIGDRQGEANSLGGLGTAYHGLGECQKAISYHEQSLKIKREIKDRHGEGVSLFNLGLSYQNLGEDKKACLFWKESSEILQLINSPHTSTVQNYLDRYCSAQ